MDSKTEPASEAKEEMDEIWDIKKWPIEKCENLTRPFIPKKDSFGYNEVVEFVKLSRFGLVEKIKPLEEEITRLKAELEKKHNDLLDALDLKEGNGPTALSMLKAELEREREKSSFLQQQIDGLLQSRKDQAPF